MAVKIILQFILGQCGRGKTTKIYEIIKEKVKNGEKNIILIVPEQISFENEKNLLNFIGNKCFSRVKVLSFTRIFDFVSKILKISFCEDITNVTETAFMALALQESKPKLKLFALDVFESETLAKMLKVFKEFESATINSSVIEKLCLKSNSKIFKQKLSEYALVFENYSKLIKNYVDKPYKNLETLVNMIKNHKIFKDYVILFDEFIGFTPKQFEILKILLNQAKEIFVAFCLEKNFESQSEFCLFAPVNKTIKSISKIANAQKIKINSPILLEKNLRCLSDDLKFLEENIFSSNKNTFKVIPKNIEIYNAQNIYEECDYVARRIKKLVFESGYRYKDFVVITRDVEEYAENFKNIFRKYAIPCFVSYPQRITETNLVVFVLSLFEVINTNFETNEVLRLLKTGFCGVEAEEISVLENYVVLWQINKKDWLEEFTLNPEGFSAKFTEENEEELRAINLIRASFIGYLIEFKENVNRGANGEKISEYIYDLILKFDIREKMKKKCNDFLLQSKLILAQTLAKSWDILISIFNEFYKILKGKKISAKNYAKLLHAVLSQKEIAFIPQSMDDVIIGSIDKIKLSSPKVLFIVGAVNDKFPKTTGDFEFFTNSELKIFSENSVFFGQLSEEIILKERFWAYEAVSTPTKKLFISWPSMSISGGGKLPSEIVNETLDIFPNIKVKRKKDENKIDFLWSYENFLEFLAENSKSDDLSFIKLKENFLKKQEYKKKLKFIENVSEKRMLNFKFAENSKLFFGKDIVISASQVEKFYKCKFGYFCQYGLKAKPSKIARFSALEHGDFIHYLLEKILKKHLSENIYELNLGVLDDEINFFSEKFVNEKLGGFKNKSKKFEYFFDKCKLTARILLNHFREEFAQSKFRCVDCELVISETGDIQPLIFNLPDGCKIKIEGKVDRVDIMKKNEENYIRVIDYKTGKKSFCFSNVVFGLDMQMLLYLFAILKNGKNKYQNVTPAGIFYMPSVFPVISQESTEKKDEVLKKISKKLCMNGLVLENLSVIKGMEKDLQGVYIPVYIKDEKIKNGENAVSIKEFDIVSNYVEKKIINMVSSLQDGKIEAIPAKDKTLACQWCEFKSICCFEDNNFNEVLSMCKEDIIKKMYEEGENSD